jgi:ubiquinone/menaquinone biosynthesis C-methylase UbiE
MELRKQEEIEYYEKKAQEWLKKKKWQSDFGRFDPSVLTSFKFCYEWLARNCKGKKVLDYGCGNRVHSIPLAKMGARVWGIDLSEKSLEIAKKRTKREGVEINFLRMDCEKMEFPDNFFDIIFDGDTFSSLDLNKVLPEIARVLKSEGFLIGIETLGHNPFTNLKRKINKLTGKRTKWAAEHIFKMEDLKRAEKYFKKIETHFFHLISWITFPILNLPGGKFMQKLFDALDKLLLKLSFLKKYSFKVVFIFSQPKKI